MTDDPRRLAAVQNDLHAQVRALLAPRRVLLLRDGLAADRAEVPSLWEQMVDALVAGGRQGSTRSVPGPRLPFDADVRDLIYDITDTVADARRSYDLAGRPGLPASLRGLAAHIVVLADADLTGWWAYRVRSWARSCTKVLGQDSNPQPRRIRDQACPSCGATHATLDLGDGPVRAPALLIDFHAGLVRSAECSVCGQQWGRWQLADLAADLDMMRAATRPEQAC